MGKHIQDSVVARLSRLPAEWRLFHSCLWVRHNSSPKWPTAYTIKKWSGFGSAQLLIVLGQLVRGWRSLHSTQPYVRKISRVQTGHWNQLEKVKASSIFLLPNMYLVMYLCLYMYGLYEFTYPSAIFFFKWTSVSNFPITKKNQHK